MAFYRGSSRDRGMRGHRGKGKGGPGDHVPSVFMENGEMNANLSEGFRSNRDPNTYNALASSLNGLDLSLNLDIREYVQKQEKIKSSSDKDAWLSQPEIPTNNEFLVAEAVLIPNRINTPYKSKDKYLRIHYGLLREDATGCLRDAIQEFRQDPTTGDTQKFSVYDQVHIVGFTFARRGLAARIKFSTSRAGKRISWESSKRLVSGSIIALVPAKDKLTDLKNLVIAIVAARPLAGVQCDPPEIDIYFGRPEDIQIDTQREWLMIEAKQGYFEAYRHTLRALQKLSQEKFPLSNEICHLSSSTDPPVYIQENPTLDIGAATPPAQKKDFSSVDVTKDWPAAPKDSLDDTQWEALKEIITRRLAIVQGPPGTGKTFVSKIALAILHANRKPGATPIIIAAQTNHALDQLLMHISHFEKDYVRLGGRSTNPEVKKRALFEIRQSERIQQIPGGLFGKSNNLMNKQSKAMIEILEPFIMPGQDPFSTNQVSGPHVLLQLGILNVEQAKSLEDGATQWVSATETVEGPLQLWLGKALIPFEVIYTKQNYGFNPVEDNDLEFEQLRENEDSNGVNDAEDIELLKGPFKIIQERFTVHPPTSADLTRASKLLDTVSDLWKIPETWRGPVYSVMQTRAKEAMAKKFREAAIVYNKLVKDHLIGKWEQDAVYLQRASIIGMTTTGLSKYRPLISALKPKTILIEEAAEVLEAPVAVACIESLEHLILVGDHQQLQGHCSVRDLEGEPFHLNVSLFERLVRNNMPFKTILRQRRMDPEFRRLIADIYPNLTDHPSVLNRQIQPWGMGNIKSFFFTHDWFELRDDSLSTFNEQEAKFVAYFYRHLFKNGMRTDQITVLTFYNGQRKRILRELTAFKEITGYKNVKTVDSYQGEENDIVILSLVRSNGDGKIGFLSNANRICVALSRAKYGFYLFGNAQALTRGSSLWYNIVTRMSTSPKRLEQVLPIRCKNHGRTVLMRYPEEWENTEGGCMEKCDTTLSCGHPCPLLCHPYSHENVPCPISCQKTLPCGHGCPNKCSDPCVCTCERFAKLKREEAASDWRQEWQPSDRLAANGELFPDNRGPQDFNGQRIPFPGRSSCLPRQHCSQSNVNPMFHTMHSLPATSPHNASLRSDYRGGGPWSSTPAETMRTNLLSPEQQRESREGWTNFASGGVAADDERRGLLGQSRTSTNIRREPQGNFNASPVKRETVTVLRDGRSRFKHQYQPEASRSVGLPESEFALSQSESNLDHYKWSVSAVNSGGGNARPSNNSMSTSGSKQATLWDCPSSVVQSPSSTRPVNEENAANTSLGDLKDLDEYYRPA